MINVMSPQDALIAAMILTSAVDSQISDDELREASATVELIPAFRGYDRDRIRLVSATVADLLQNEDGLETLIGMMKSALPDYLKETAYALACDVAAADGNVQLEEMRLLEMLRHGFRIDRLNAAAIERGARARHTPIRKS